MIVNGLVEHGIGGLAIMFDLLPHVNHKDCSPYVYFYLLFAILFKCKLFKLYSFFIGPYIFALLFEKLQQLPLFAKLFSKYISIF